MPSPLRNLLRRVIPRSVRNSLRNPVKTTRALWQRNFGRPVTVQINRDWAVRCHPAAAEGFRLFVDEPAIRAELDQFIAHAKPGMVLFDIGAHHGLLTLTALRYGGPTTRVVAVEPSPGAAGILAENLRLMGDSDSVQVIRAAAGSSTGSLPMLDAGAGAWGYFVPSDPSRPDATSVPMVTVDRLVEETGLIPTHLKIDVEGFEGEVLDGARMTLSCHRPIVFLELHNELIQRAGKSPEDILVKLFALGYETPILDGRPYSPSGSGPDRLVCLPGNRQESLRCVR
jgi:FkbM family methyltransferase